MPTLFPPPRQEPTLLTTNLPYLEDVARPLSTFISTTIWPLSFDPFILRFLQYLPILTVLLPSYSSNLGRQISNYRR